MFRGVKSPRPLSGFRGAPSQSYLSAVEHGRNEIGAEVLLAISREFGKSLEWLLTGEE